jgi:hypothetical protein
MLTIERKSRLDGALRDVVPPCRGFRRPTMCKWLVRQPRRPSGAPRTCIGASRRHPCSPRLPRGRPRLIRPPEGGPDGGRFGSPVPQGSRAGHRYAELDPGWRRDAPDADKDPDHQDAAGGRWDALQRMPGPGQRRITNSKSPPSVTRAKPPPVASGRVCFERPGPPARRIESSERGADRTSR